MRRVVDRSLRKNGAADTAGMRERVSRRHVTGAAVKYKTEQANTCSVSGTKYKRGCNEEPLHPLNLANLPLVDTMHHACRRSALFCGLGGVCRGAADGKEKVCAPKKCACSLLRSFLPAAIAVLIRCVRRAVKRLNANVRKPNPEDLFLLLCHRRSQ